MVIKSIKILIVDDDPDDAFLAARYIKKGFQDAALSIDHAGSFSEMESHLETSEYDLFLIDYHLGQVTGLKVIRSIKKRGIKSPMILLTGQGDERVAVAAMKEGVSDYLPKDLLSQETLCNAIRYSMELFQAEARRKKAEKALKRSEEKYRTMINTTTEGYWLFDLTLKTVDLNTALCSMLGYSREEILSKSLNELFGEKECIPVKGALTNTLSTDHKVFVTVLKTKAGLPVHAIFNATTLRNRKGKPLEIFALVTDIRKQKETEERLKNANEALQQINLMKSDFVSNVSHELRTPLTSIKNAIGILVKGAAGPFNDTQERFLKMAARNIDRLAALTNDVLDLSKMEARQLNIQASKLQLGALLQNIIALFQAQAKEKDIQFEADMPQILPPVYADPDRVEQILCNLLSNALKFTPRRGRVLLSADEDGERVTLSISDTGPGLSPEEQRRVFERFYQAGGVFRKTTHGTGLGLSISKELAELQQGKISVQSEEGKGCRFFFTLPVFSQGAVEMAALEKTLRGLQKDSVFSLVVIVLHPEKSFQDPAPGAEALNQVGALIRKTLRQESDTTILQPSFGRIICLLPGTSKADAMTAKERLERRLAVNSVFDEWCQTHAPNTIRAVGYPEDGKTGTELIASATSTTLKEGRENGQEKSAHCGR